MGARAGMGRRGTVLERGCDGEGGEVKEESKY